MLTMGVARSLGDFELCHRASGLNMKEFLSPQPEVKVYRMAAGDTREDVLVMATDGMWDVLTNKSAKILLLNKTRRFNFTLKL